MRRHSGAGHDPLASSLTDLMTSLMVIFVLLLLVFMQRTAGANAAVTDALLRRLQMGSEHIGLRPEHVRQDPRDRDAILVVIPDGLMNFEIGKYTLKPAGIAFLDQHIPRLADILCAPEFQASVQSIVVEGHSDDQVFRGLSPAASQEMNLKLSQDRSMEVVKRSLLALANHEASRNCVFERLSASGRGDQEPEKTQAESRRVVLKIRVKAREAREVEQQASAVSPVQVQ